MRSRDLESLMNFVYPHLGSPFPPPPDYFFNRMILAPRNTDVNDVNQKLLDRMNADTTTSNNRVPSIHEFLHSASIQWPLQWKPYGSRQNVGTSARISLIPTSTTDFTFKFRRRQFPVRLAFAITINRAQGQSVKYVGVDLRIPVS